MAIWKVSRSLSSQKFYREIGSFMSLTVNDCCCVPSGRLRGFAGLFHRPYLGRRAKAVSVNILSSTSRSPHFHTALQLGPTKQRCGTLLAAEPSLSTLSLYKHQTLHLRIRQ